MDNHNILELPVEQFTGLEYQCGCGRTHSVKIRQIKCESNIGSDINNFLKNFEFKNIMTVCDTNTYKAFGRELQDVLAARQPKCLVLNPPDKDHDLVPDEGTLGRILLECENIDFLIACGSGTINDLCRMISSRLKIPYIITGTASSMDGYASTVSPLIVDKMKITYNAVYPEAIFADTNVLKNAPPRLTQAGIGDILGKFTALSDWELSKKVTDEYYCDTIVNIMKKAVNNCVDMIKHFDPKERELYKNLFDALVLSGIAMGMAGSSRPASGAEHHMAHFWEVDALKKGKAHPLHGQSVGVAACISAFLYRQAKEDGITDISVISPEEIKVLLDMCGAVSSPLTLGVDRDLFYETIINAMYIRPRYTIFHLIKNNGLLDKYASKAIEYFY